MGRVPLIVASFLLFFSIADSISKDTYPSSMDRQGGDLLCTLLRGETGERLRSRLDNFLGDIEREGSRLEEDDFLGERVLLAAAIFYVV